MAGPQPVDPPAPGDREPARAHLHGRVGEQARRHPHRNLWIGEAITFGCVLPFFF